jgi:hypothetical protein
MVTPEDVIPRRKIQVQIVHEIERVVTFIVNETPKSEPDIREEFDPSKEPSTADLQENQILRKRPMPSNCVPHFLFPLETFHVLQDNNILPESVQGMRVKYELDRNRLLVQVMASPAHDAAANAWNGRIAIWSMNGGAGPKTLMQCGQGRTFLF